MLSFGGKSFAWLSLTTLVLVLFTIVMFVLFIRTEKNIDQNIAIFPVSMMRSKVLMGCAIGQFCMSANSTCLYVYIPYYMQQEMGTTATQAGAATSIISLMTTVFGAILLVAMVTARHSVFGLITVVGEAIALVLISIFISPTLSVMAMYVLVIFYGLTQSVESYAFTMTLQAGVSTQGNCHWNGLYPVCTPVYRCCCHNHGIPHPQHELQLRCRHEERVYLRRCADGNWRCHLRYAGSDQRKLLSQHKFVFEY